MIRAAKLDTNLYEEVEADHKAMGQAMFVVVLSSIATGIGAGRLLSVGGMIMMSIIALISWYAWAYLTYFIGTRLLPEPRTHADHGQLLRTLGFAASPGLIHIAGFIPGLGGLIIFIGSAWMLAATVIAVRQALDVQQYRKGYRSLCYWMGCPGVHSSCYAFHFRKIYSARKISFLLYEMLFNRRLRAICCPYFLCLGYLWKRHLSIFFRASTGVCSHFIHFGYPAHSR